MRDRNRKYTRTGEGLRNSNLIFIFCEGVRTERRYFFYFNKISSRIVIQLMPQIDGQQSPMGLYETAIQLLVDGRHSEYNFSDGDEVWFVFDTDHYSKMISELRPLVKKRADWNIAQSNPSFEVWLYYHFFEEAPKDPIKNWKTYLNEKLPGGFDNRAHPRFIQRAIHHSKRNFSTIEQSPDINSTEVHFLGEKIFSLVKNELDLINSKSDI